MPRNIKKKIIRVREHPRHVEVSSRNPGGVTVVDAHTRLIEGKYLDRDGIESIYKKYDRTKIKFPSKNKLPYKAANDFDEIIAIWTDFFNSKFPSNPPLDPDVVKALIASESGFDIDPPGNKVAFGIAQITKETLRVMQDPKGEAKDFIFKKIRLKDLKNPTIAIPLAIRWIFRKKIIATSKLKREALTDEIILEYKGMLKSNTLLKKSALFNFRKNFNELKKN